MTPAESLGLLRAMLGDLEPYLLSNEIYWPLRPAGPHATPYPNLTLGALLAVLHRLRAEQEALTPAQRAEYDRLTLAAEALRSRWAANFDRKAERELRARLDAWAHTLRDFEEHPDDRANYASAVNVRVMIELLLEALAERPEAEMPRARLAEHDARLRTMLIPGGFLWEPALAPHYPGDRFWYLHGRLALSER